MDFQSNSTFPEMPVFIFTWIDYTVFVILLSLSVFIGIYFGCFGTKQNSTIDYLLGGKNMTVTPVGVSLIASYISGITMLAVPADVYRYGANYLWCCLCFLIACLATAFIYLPIIFKLQYTTVYEYLKHRFDKKTSVFASFLYTMTILIYNPVVMYIPALAFSQATGINVHYITPVLTAICIFYTTIGGLKAVIWSDALQFIAMVGAAITCLVMGIKSAGGLEFIFKENIKGDRLDLFNFQADLTFRDGFWAYSIGGTTFWTFLFATSQGPVQKYLSLPTLSQARKAIAIFCVGMIAMTAISTFMGNVLYAKYHDCDPFKSNQIKRQDQILPLFVMSFGGNIPGISGLFIGGIFSAALSSLSSALNTVSGTIYQDFILPFMPHDTTQKTASNVLKVIVIISGITCILLVFLIENMGGAVPLIFTFQGITGGPILALFTLGVLFPMANSKGAFYGGILGLLLVSWIALMNQYYSMTGRLQDFSKPVSIDGCNFYVNSSKSSITLQENPFILYQISYMYNTVMGMIFVIVIGLIISWLTRRKDEHISPEFINPIAHFLLPGKRNIKNATKIKESGVK